MTNRAEQNWPAEEVIEIKQPSNQQVVLAKYPDASVMSGALTARFMVVSSAWWPGCIGWGSTRARAWKDAATAIRRGIERVSA